MKLTILLDLDDTLLANNMDGFLPVYLKGLSSYLVDVPAQLMIQQLLAATQKMIEKNTPALTLQQVFDAHFFPAIGRQRSELQPAIDRFYAEGFPALQKVTRPIPQAVDLVEQLIEKGCLVAIATNPLFPRTATLQRLEWAGMPIEKFPFALVSTYELFHFAKPNPAYVAEILAQLGWPDQPAVMVGNSLEDDLVPAARLGLPTFWTTGESRALPPDFPPFSMAGTISEVLPWLESIAAASLKPQFKTREALLAILKSAPAALDAHGARLAPEDWRKRPSPKDWSLVEITCHWRDVDIEVNLPRLQQVVQEDNPFLAGAVTDPWVEERQYNRQDGHRALQDWISARTRLVQMLEALPPESWQRPARHAIFGPTSLFEMVSFIATHDRAHLRQVKALVDTL